MHFFRNIVLLFAIGIKGGVLQAEDPAEKGMRRRCLILHGIYSYAIWCKINQGIEFFDNTC